MLLPSVHLVTAQHNVLFATCIKLPNDVLLYEMHCVLGTHAVLLHTKHVQGTRRWPKAWP